MSLQPFEYQVQAIADCREAIRKGKSKVILCMLMGAGKSLCAFELMRLCSEKGKRSMFLCDRRMLADQALERARQQGLHAGVIMSGRVMDLNAPCQFASKQTVESWLKRERIEVPAPDLIIQDECHRAISQKNINLFNRWPNAVRIGLTATPCLGNGDGMGAYYDALIQPIMPSKLRELGRIVPVRAFAPHVPDLTGVKKDKDGDYSVKSLAERMNRENLIGDVAGWYKRLGENRPAIYFSCDVAHALSIRDEFRSQGVTSEMICDETPDDERDDIRRRSKSGDVTVVVNCDVLSEGIDWPWISCIGLVRPTKRLRRYLQNSGRGMRSDPESGKVDCVIIDHSGCVLYHGFPDIDREWPLDPCDNADKKNQEKPPGEKGTIQCVKCTAIFKGSRTCPECGHVHAMEKKPKDYAQSNGTLIEVSKGADMPPDAAKVLMQRYWCVCIGVAIKKGRKASMAAGMFSGKFGKPPWQAGVSPLPQSSKQWHEPASYVFPGFVKGKAKAMAGDAYEDE